MAGTAFVVVKLVSYHKSYKMMKNISCKSNYIEWQVHFVYNENLRYTGAIS